MPSIRPFETDERLQYPYPTPKILEDYVLESNHQDLKFLARLWLSEGVPWVFREQPSLYEMIRDWFGDSLEVDPKEITLIGSARIGFSMAGDKFGREFKEGESDLDFSVVSATLWVRLAEDFKRWQADYEAGAITPCSERQRRFWDDNLRRIPMNLQRGFIDPHLIPSTDKYRWVKRILNSCWLLSERLGKTRNVPKPKRVSVRVYRDWESFVRQAVVNANHLRRSLLERLAVVP